MLCYFYRNLAPKVPGVPTKTRLKFRIQAFNPLLIHRPLPIPDADPALDRCHDYVKQIEQKSSVAEFDVLQGQ